MHLVLIGVPTPHSIGIAHTLGLVHVDKRNYQRALDSLVRAAMLDPRSWSTLTALGGVYLRLGAREMAAQALEHAKVIRPQNAEVLIALGEIYSEECEYELAKAAYAQALALDENSAAAAQGLGLVCAFIGQDTEAAQVLQRMIKPGMRSLEALNVLADLPRSLIGIDVLAEMSKVAHDPSEDKMQFETLAAFTRAAALDQAGRHAEAWEQAVTANRKMSEAVRGSCIRAADRQRESL
jgi:tetratricopeptide (TPR) repeat protein